MKFLFPVILTIMALFAPLSSSAAEKKDDQHIKSIFFQKINDTEVVQIRLSGKIVPKIFELAGEKPRVVLDFVDTGYGPNKMRTIKAGGDLVGKIRVGLHEKPVAKTRVVIDMVVGMKYTFSKEYIAANTIFKITFSTPQAQTADKSSVPAVPVEQVKNTELAAPSGGETGKKESAATRKEMQNSVDEKHPEESATAVVPAAKISEKPDQTEERESDTKVDSREAGLEESKQNNTDKIEALIPEVEDEEKQILLDVHFEKNTNGKEMVLFHLNGFYPPVVYSAESGGLLVVCDFLDAELAHNDIPEITKGDKYIRQIKVEPHQQPKKVRVVVELADGYTYDVKQVFFKEENLFVIVLNNLGEKNKKN